MGGRTYSLGVLLYSVCCVLFLSPELNVAGSIVITGSCTIRRRAGGSNWRWRTEQKIHRPKLAPAGRRRTERKKVGGGGGIEGKEDSVNHE